MSAPLLVSASSNLSHFDIMYILVLEIKDKELLEIGLILQLNTNLEEFRISSRALGMNSIEAETVFMFIEILSYVSVFIGETLILLGLK